MPLSRRVLVAVPASALLLGGVLTALPSSAAADYTDAGSASAPSPIGFGATDTAFTGTCPDPGPAQGVDGWVFALPADVAVAGTQVSITGTSGGAPVDVSAYVYGDDCAYLRSEVSDGALQVRLTDADRYLSVYTTTGSDTAFALTATTGPVVDPSPSASPSPSATSDPGTGTLRGRHTYSATPNDPLYPEDSELLGFQGQWGMQKIRAAEAWQQPRATGAGVQVGVLDSGLDLGHPDFACDGKIRVAPGATTDGSQPQDVDGHGTHVAGIIGACTDNNEGVVGVAPDATVVPFRILGPDGGTAEDLAKGIHAAVDAGVHVINMSIGFGISAGGVATVPGSGSAVALAGVFADIDQEIEYATSKGVVVVAAAGNETFPLCGYPALADKVVCVGSTDRRDLPAWYGNFPVKADGGAPAEGAALVAPGGSGQVFCDVASENILSTYARDLNDCPEGGGYRGLDGTSMASPHVAGVAALVYDRLGAVRSPENAAKVVQALEDGAVDLGTPGYDPVFGYGRVDALGAVQAVTPVPDPTPSASTTPVAAPTSLALSAPASAQWTDGLDVRAVLTDSTGAPIAGQPVQLGITGGPSAQLVTDATGAVTSHFAVDQEPGDYELSATYAGAPAYEPSGAHQPLSVLAEDTVTKLALSGKSNRTVLTASLTDADSPGSGVAGVPVTFLVDDAPVGSATTDSNGVASLAVAKKAKSTYEARFGGDSRWRPSAASAGA